MAWMSYRNALLTSMGLAPIALTGCDTPQAQAELAQEQVAPPVVLSLMTGFDTGTTLFFDVDGAFPGSQVYLVAGTQTGQGPCPSVLQGQCFGISNAQLVGTAVADGTGYAQIEALIPYDVPDGLTVHVQAAATINNLAFLSNVVTGPTTHPRRTCGELPFLDGSNYLNVFDATACGPIPPSGVCPDVSQFTYQWNQQLARYAIGFDPGPFFDFNVYCYESTIEDACCYAGFSGQIVIGRPFTVNGAERVAQTGSRCGWTSDVTADASGLPRRVRRHLARCWANTAAGEHASVASFARFVMHLLAVGAPSDLLDDAAAAMHDEIRHAADAFAIASALQGESLGPAALDTADDLVPSLRDIVLSAAREGCVAETVAAAQAAEAARLCVIPEVKAVLEGVAADEQRHATLAWRFVRWAVSEHPELRDDVAAALAEGLELPVARAGALDDVMRAWGCLPVVDQAAVAQQVLDEVVAPCASAMLQAPATVVHAQA